MGVPGLWPFIQQNFPKGIIHFASGSQTQHFDHVYLDANGLLHAAAQHVENYGEKKRRLNPYENLSITKRRNLIFEKFFDNIIEVVNTIIPRKTLYIAIDGPAPRAKQNQQRERRFVAAKLRKTTEDLSGETKFDSACISPGTEFMHHLSTYMHWRIRNYMQYHNNWKNINVIYSPPTVPGEGEHKCLDYMRSLTKESREKHTHCIFGPDGDLLMLALSVHINKISLFREDQYEPGYVDLVNMGQIRYWLTHNMAQNHAVMKLHTRNIHDVSDDFVFIGFFVGNDFLPKIKMFYRLKNGLDTMLNIYKKLTNAKKYLIENNLINIKTLQLFVGELADYEQKFIADQAMITATEEKFIDSTLLKYAKVVNVDNGGENIKITSIDMAGYRKEYYTKAGIHFDDDFEVKVQEMCKDYLRNLIWVHIYYSQTLPSWGQSYNWHYAPLMLDLKNYILTLTQIDAVNISNFIKMSPSLPFEQLMTIISPYSQNLLPEEYRTLITNKDSILVTKGYYPTDFEIDYEGKVKEYQGIAKLPFVNYEDISEAYKNVAAKSKYKYHKNTFGSNWIFKWDKTHTVTYTSVLEYTTAINGCHVKVDKLFTD